MIDLMMSFKIWFQFYPLVPPDEESWNPDNSSQIWFQLFLTVSTSQLSWNYIKM